MNTPIPPKCLSVEVNDVTRSIIRLDHGCSAVRDRATEAEAVEEEPAEAQLPTMSLGKNSDALKPFRDSWEASCPKSLTRN